MFSDLLYRLRALLRRKTVETELDDELRFHFDKEVEKLVRSGAAPEEARRRTRLSFGGDDQIKEECRQARGLHLLETCVQDIRYGTRMLYRKLGFTMIAVFTLALEDGPKHVMQIISPALKNNRTILTKHESKQVLPVCELPVTPSRLARSVTMPRGKEGHFVSVWWENSIAAKT